MRFFGLEVRGELRYAADASLGTLRGEALTTALDGFVNSLLDHSAAPLGRSEPLPSQPTDGAVTVVVGDTYAELVGANGRDVLLMVYAPWCAPAVRARARVLLMGHGAKMRARAHTLRRVDVPRTATHG